MWEAVELREIRVFLTVAEELHFGRSADRLCVSQSRVSQTVRQLETKLGTPLFERTSRRVELTRAGAGLLAAVRGPHDELARVLRDADATSRGLTGALRLALIIPPAGGRHLVEIIAAFEAQHPGCRVVVSDVVDWPDWLGLLRRGDADLVANRLPLSHDDITIGPVLSREERVLAVAREHPLAQRGSVSVEALADYRVPRIAGMAEDQYEAYIPGRTPSGREIARADASPRTLSEIFTLVARGEIVHPTVRSVGEYIRHPDIVFVPISGLPPSETALVWRRGTRDPRVAAFAAVAEAVLSGERATAPQAT
jgi:DNA-binding transcriptional LysR family regulator